jgi:hypothetical protein
MITFYWRQLSYICQITSTEKKKDHHNPFSGMDVQHGHALHITRSVYALHEIKAQKWKVLVTNVETVYWLLWKCVACATLITPQCSGLTYSWDHLHKWAKEMKKTLPRRGGGRFWISLANDKQLATWTLIFSLHLINECNKNCTCDNLKYTPVCSETYGMTYYSACHAGCSYVFNNSKVSLCLGIMRLTAAEGLDSSCSFIMHHK